MKAKSNLLDNYVHDKIYTMINILVQKADTQSLVYRTALSFTQYQMVNSDLIITDSKKKI